MILYSKKKLLFIDFLLFYLNGVFLFKIGFSPLRMKGMVVNNVTTPIAFIFVVKLLLGTRAIEEELRLV